MGWDAIIVGELVFPEGAMARWQTTPALNVDYGWPELIANAVDESMYGDDEEPSVADVLAQSAEQDHWFGTLAVGDRDVRIAYNVDNSNYSIVAERVVRLACAAAHVGASGRILFCDAGSAIAQSFHWGGLIELAEGELTALERNERLAPEDKQRIDACVRETIARAATLDAERARLQRMAPKRAKTRPAKPNPKAKPKARPRRASKR